MEDTITVHKDLQTRVLSALETIRPFLNKDGGDIELVDIQGARATVRLLGNCSGCPVSFSTMKLGVENTIKQNVPEIKEVVSVE